MSKLLLSVDSELILGHFVGLSRVCVVFLNNLEVLLVDYFSIDFLRWLKS